MLVLGIVASLAANVAQGWSRGLVGAVVAAWPAVSLVESYEMLVWIIYTAAADGLAREPSSRPRRGAGGPGEGASPRRCAAGAKTTPPAGAGRGADQGSAQGRDGADRAYQEGDHFQTDSGMAGNASGKTHAATVPAYRISRSEDR